MIYLDNSATTQPYEEAIDSFITVSKKYFGNPSSLHNLGSQAEGLLTKSREQLAKLLKVKPSEIIFTSGGTEGNNLAIKGIALQNRSRGNHIITTSIEHPSVTDACKHLEQFGFKVTYLPVNENGFASLHDLKEAINEETILVSIIHVNNEVGTIQPIKEIGHFLERYPKIAFHVDHVQGIGKVPLHLKQAKIDVCTMSAHKFHGLKGTGILYIREGVRLSPLFNGGSQEMQFRSGTENVAGIVAMSKALRMTLEKHEIKIERMSAIKRTLMDELSNINLIKLNTSKEQSAPHIVNFSINGLKSEVFVHELEKHHIFVSTTSACSSRRKAPSKTLLAMGKEIKIAESGIRISLSYNNKIEEVPIIIEAIDQSLNKLRR